MACYPYFELLNLQPIFSVSWGFEKCRGSYGFESWYIFMLFSCQLNFVKYFKNKRFCDAKTLQYLNFSNFTTMRQIFLCKEYVFANIQSWIFTGNLLAIFAKKLLCIIPWSHDAIGHFPRFQFFSWILRLQQSYFCNKLKPEIYWKIFKN